MDQNSDAGARFAPPTARIDDPSPAPGELVLASRGNRFLGVLIDTLLAALVIWLVSLVTPWRPFSAAAQNGFLPMLATQAISFGLFVLVQGWLLLKHGQTVGKRLLRMRIVQPDGRRVDAVRLILVRYGLGFAIGALPMFGLVMVYAVVDGLLIFRQPRRCLHDLIADTIVVRT